MTGAAVAGVSIGLFSGGVLTKEVRLAVDGGETTVRSFGGTVRDVLAEVRVDVGPGDEVYPARDDEVADGGSIVVRHARPLVLIVDGRRSTHTVTALNVGEALQELNLSDRRAMLSASWMRQIPVSGFALDVRTQRRVTVVRGRVRLDALTTGRTVRSVLAQQKITLARGDRVRPSMGTFPEENAVIRIIPALPPRPARPLAPSGAGRPLTPVRQAAPPRPLHTVAVRHSVTALNWTALARCESYANPRSVNPRGPYYGMYQFSLAMWQAVGGTGRPIDWPATEQTYRAQLLYQRVAGRWRGQWPACGARLFAGGTTVKPKNRPQAAGGVITR
ncbi:resuscitation-promoting factor [Sphaerisporangium corydalis]|uniref:Ubiquitin-like domain-containing protein n=1 Tax=Sphaerisporangium corydalis TaxID=1441875 RepID=A0ABV9ESF2_9ACTN|nr:resuscitation-promoting factor [Sphaerisporangium corydalis]